MFALLSLISVYFNIFAIVKLQRTVADSIMCLLVAF